MQRVNEPDDPRRCKGNTGTEQCWYVAATGSEFCTGHNGRDHSESINKRAYLLAQAADQAQLARFSESETIKSLRDEIALARMMVERHWNAIKTDNDFVSRSSSVNTLLLTIERLVKSSHSIEQSMQSLLGREHVIAFGQMLVQAVMDELVNVPGCEHIMDRVVAKVFATLSGGAANLIVVPQLPAK